MNYKKTLLLFFIIQTGFVFSQFKGTYQFPEKFNKSYFFDPVASYQKLSTVKIPGFTEDQIDNYRIHKTFDVQRQFDNNAYYLEWYELEKYLYKLVDTILPLEVKSKQPYDVFIERDIDFNAHALGNGFVFANIGLLANCNNEAELAYILGHEIGHSIFNHGYMINSDFISAYNNNNISQTSKEYMLMFDKSRKAELQSDSFAYACLNKVQLNLNTIINSLNILQFSEASSLFYVNKSRRGSYKDFMNTFGTHPNSAERKKLLNSFRKKTKVNGSNFIIDSLYFKKIKKIAHEECKKISMESGDFENALKLSFIDYLHGDDGLKNLFYIFESIRRLLYRDPKIKDKGFLAEDLQYSEFEYFNSSVLKKPEVLFIDSLQFAKASSHPLLTNKEKPFNTYEQAYLYFINLAEIKGFNEVFFSKALFHYAKKDEIKFKENLLKYIEKGGGIFTDCANNLNQFGFPYIKEGKTTVLIDNSTNFSSSDNYYHSLQRISYNNDIHEIFKKDSAKVELTIMNELLGVKPKMLYNYQKLKWNIFQLYNETDTENYYKKKYQAKENMDERAKRDKFNKNLIIYVPEWYKWFKENNLNGIVYQKMDYSYKSVRETEEYTNSYDLGYFNFFDNRPFFGKCIRNGNIRKQKTVEMVSDAREYLFYKE
jgi:hypothetical protein